MKLLSVAVPCYNVEPYLEKCLSSFCGEGLEDALEVLIVDDGSQDKTAEIARGFVAQHPEIFRLIEKENGGHGSAVNAGIDAAAGKYFRIVDGDDWVDTGALGDFLRRLADTDTDLVVDQKTRVDMVTGTKRFISLPAEIPFGKPVSFLDYSGDALCHFYSLHTVTVRTSLLKEHDIRLQEHCFYVDNEYLLKAMAYSRYVTFYNLDVYRYLVGNQNQSVSHQSYVKRYGQHERVIKECLRFAAREEWPPALRAYMRRRILPLLRTHFLIALVYNENRAQGEQNAKAFWTFLQRDYPSYARAVARRRRLSWLLHRLGFNDERLERLKKRLHYSKSY